MPWPTHNPHDLTSPSAHPSQKKKRKKKTCFLARIFSNPVVDSCIQHPLERETNRQVHWESGSSPTLSCMKDMIRKYSFGQTSSDYLLSDSRGWREKGKKKARRHTHWERWGRRRDRHHSFKHTSHIPLDRLDTGIVPHEAQVQCNVIRYP